MSDKSRYSREEIAAAAREALGRTGRAASDPALYEAYRNFRGDKDELLKAFAGSAEAQKRKIDGSKYGVTYVDPAALDEKDRSLYDAYARVYGAKARMSTGLLEVWRKHGSPELLEAEERGDVSVQRTEGGKRILTVSADAWKKYGPGLLSGLHTGEVAKIEKGAGEFEGVNDAVEGVTNRFRLYEGEETKEGGQLADYYVYSKDPKKSTGVVGGIAKTLGAKKGLANSLDKAAGQVVNAAAVAATVLTGGAAWPALALTDETAAIAGGSRGAAARIKQMKGLGLSDDTIGVIDAVGNAAQSVAAAAADVALAPVTGGAPVVSMANKGLQALAQDTSGQKVDWEKVAIDVGVDLATWGLGKGLTAASAAATAAGWTSLAAAAEGTKLALQFGGADALKVAAMGGSSEDIAWAAGKGLVRQLLPTDYTFGPAGEFALEYAHATARGMEGKDAFLMGTLAAGQRIAGNAVMGSVEREAGNTFGKRWNQAVGGAQDLASAARGQMPASYVENAHQYYNQRFSKLTGGKGVPYVPGQSARADQALEQMARAYTRNGQPMHTGVAAEYAKLTSYRARAGAASRLGGAPSRAVRPVMSEQGYIGG